MSADWLRPSEAVARFGVSRSTLRRWASAGLIGRSEVGRVVYYDAADVRALIDGHASQRRLVSLAAPAPARGAWRDHSLWREAR